MCWSNHHRKPNSLAQWFSTCVLSLWGEGLRDGVTGGKMVTVCSGLFYLQNHNWPSNNREFGLFWTFATYNSTTPSGLKMHQNAESVAHLDDWVSSCQGLHSSPAALRLVVGSVVGLGLHFDLQAVWPRAGRQLPVKGGQGRTVRVKKKNKKICVNHCHVYEEGGGGLILAAVIVVECAEREC